mmetsp:Transcript_4981/g.9185  ORF Transcript_4981/g.9185 Transcript_4981/m.9185 type:complete len:607 (-) Transcript_4981:1256-3076(-)
MKYIFFIFCLFSSIKYFSYASISYSLNNGVDFYMALSMQNVTDIIITGSFQLSSEYWGHIPSTLNITRNVTIRSTAPEIKRYPQIDFNFVTDKVNILPGYLVMFENVTIYNSFSTVTVTLDFFSGSSGGFVMWNGLVNHLLLCMPIEMLVTFLNLDSYRPVTYLSPNGTHQNVTAENSTLCINNGANCYSTYLHAYDMMAKSTKGYYLGWENSRVVCDNFVTYDCMNTYGDPICYANTLSTLVLATGTSTTTSSSNRTTIIIAAVVGGGGGLLFLSILVFVIFHFRRLRTLAHSRVDVEQPLKGSWPTSSDGFNPHQEMLLTAIMASLRKGTGSTMNSGGGSDSTATPALLQLLKEGLGGSHGMAGPEQQAFVTLGKLVGAGSFGRVYQGTWHGVKVAVKVISHSQRSTAAIIDNEVKLSLKFDHPNVVKTLTCISCSVNADGKTLVTLHTRPKESVAAAAAAAACVEGSWRARKAVGAISPSHPFLPLTWPLRLVPHLWTLLLLLLLLMVVRAATTQVKSALRLIDILFEALLCCAELLLHPLSPLHPGEPVYLSHPFPSFPSFPPSSHSLLGHHLLSTRFLLSTPHLLLLLLFLSTDTAIGLVP